MITFLFYSLFHITFDDNEIEFEINKLSVGLPLRLTFKLIIIWEV